MVAPADEDDDREHAQNAGCARQQEGRAVLANQRPVALDPVDPVGPPLDLRHRRGPRDQRGYEPGREGGLARFPPRAGRALLQRLAEQVAGRARGEGADGLLNDPAERLLVERLGQPHHRDQRREERQRDLERQGPGVAEPVTRAEPVDRVDHEAAATPLAESLECFVALELTVGVRDRGRGRHRPSVPVGPAFGCSAGSG